MKRFLSLFIALLLLLMGTALADSATASLQEMYSEAELLMVQGDYAGAAAKFEALAAYSDAAQMTLYCKAIYAANNGMYVVSVDALSSLGQFKDAPQLAQYYTACSYLNYAQTGDNSQIVNYETYADLWSENMVALFTDPDYELLDSRLVYCYRAKAIFSELALYKDCMTKMTECDTCEEEYLAGKIEAKYQSALKQENEGNYSAAIDLYQSLGEYKDSAERQAKCHELMTEQKYQAALALEEKGEYQDAIAALRAMNGYKDSDAHINACMEMLYQQALTAKANGDYKGAVELFRWLGDYKDSAEHLDDYYTTQRLRNLKTIGEFNNGVATVYLGKGQYGAIDETGNLLFTTEYELDDFHDGYARAGQDEVAGYTVTGVKEGVIDAQGNMVLDVKKYTSKTWGALHKVVSDGMILNTEKCKFINVETGQEFPYARTGWKDQAFSEGLLCFTDESSDKVGYVDTDGNIVIDAKFTFASDFHNGYAVVSKDDYKSGRKEDNRQFIVIDTSGNTVLEIDKAYTSKRVGFVGEGFFNGLYRVDKNGKHGFIDLNGNLVIDFQFDASDFANGYAKVEQDEKFGFIDTTGALVIPYEWDEVSDFMPNGLAIVKRGKLYGLIDGSGTLVLEPVYKSIQWSDCNTIPVHKDDGWYLLNEKGEVIR